MLAAAAGGGGGGGERSAAGACSQREAEDAFLLVSDRTRNGEWRGTAATR